MTIKALRLTCPACENRVLLTAYAGTPVATGLTNQSVCTEEFGEDHLNAIVEALAAAQHDAYEEAAVAAGWETQARSRKPWAQVPEENKQTVRASVRTLITTLYRM